MSSKNSRLTALAVTAAISMGGLAAALPSNAQAGGNPATVTASTGAPVTQKFTSGSISGTVTFTKVSDEVYNVSISGTNTSSAPGVVPLGLTSGLLVPTGPKRMDSNLGNMDLGQKAAVFTFDSSYLENYQAPFTVSGSFNVFVTTNQTSTQVITVGGIPFSIPVVSPALAKRANGYGARIMVTKTYQIDRAVLKSTDVANLYFAADDDGWLKYRELSKLWMDKKYAKNFSETHEFVTVTIPKNATDAEKITAINKATKIGDVTTTTKAGSVKKVTKPVVSVYAWEVDVAHGATSQSGGAAWGPKRNLPEKFAARS